jgi:hypothetical protein
MKKNILVIAVGASLLAWGCSKTASDLNLKQSVEKGVADINNAISSISETKGYQMLTLGGDLAKSDESFNDSITLGLIAGIYDFQPSPVMTHHFYYPYRLFKKTGTSDKMIVNLPERMIYHPKYLRNYNPGDSVPKNNFTITAFDYHYYYSWWNSLDYKLSADLTLNAEAVGSMDVAAASKSWRDNLYSSEFTFKEGYSIAAEWQTGDTTVSSFALLKDDDILLKEARVFIWNAHHKGEKQYTLTIGNVDIKKMTGVDSIQVYLDGVLQKEAAAIITDDSDTTGTICHKRDILLTFDDGTTAKLSEMINPALTSLRTLIDSLHSMYFAKNIVDYIAVSIYYNTH